MIKQVVSSAANAVSPHTDSHLIWVDMEVMYYMNVFIKGHNLPTIHVLALLICQAQNTKYYF